MTTRLASQPASLEASRFQDGVLVALGAAATLAAVAVTMRFNFLYGYGLGQTMQSAWLFGWANVFVDSWNHERGKQLEEIRGSATA